MELQPCAVKKFEAKQGGVHPGEMELGAASCNREGLLFCSNETQCDGQKFRRTLITQPARKLDKFRIQLSVCLSRGMRTYFLTFIGMIKTVEVKELDLFEEL